MIHSYTHDAYRPGQSTETALLKVVNDTLSELDEGKFSVLVLLDLSAAFDTTDHDILLYRLHHVFGIQGTALSWFKSYLTNRFQMVSIQVFFLIQLNCVVVYLRVLSLDLSFSFSTHNLSLMSFLTIQYLTCCTLMIRRYINPVPLMIWLRPFFV